MPVVKCKIVKKHFPFAPEEEIDFCACTYRSLSGDLPDGMAAGEEFKATGRLLPYAADCTITLSGEWQDSADGRQLKVASAEYDTPKAFTEIRSILLSMPYFDEKGANRAVNEYGADALRKFDANPELLEKFVKKPDVQRAILGYKLRRTQKPVFMYLVNRKIRSETAVDIAMKVPSLAALNADPFGFSVGTKLSFKAAEKIAKDENVPANTLSGAMASIVDVVQQAEGSSDGDAFQEGEPAGNTYVELQTLTKKASGQVGLLRSDPLMKSAFEQLLVEKIICVAQGKYVYRSVTADAEYGIATELVRLNSAAIPQVDFQNDIAQFQMQNKMRLAPEQIKAAKTALVSPVTLLIGGPGTGKTTIERVIISMYRRAHPKKKVTLVAPTGKAACRMSESTGDPATTVHKALNVVAGDEVLHSKIVLEPGLILVDEASMLGGQEAWALLKAVPTGTQVVIVGDTNQLPSVGAGNVLSELIRSKTFALAQLITVYRQKSGSTIATNCARIKLGKTELDYTDTFQMKTVSSQEEAVSAVLSAIHAEMDSGLTLDDICVLSPYRRSTVTGTNHLNDVIQNEFADQSSSITYGKRVFYIRDKVMFKANRDDAVNGDVGNITEIKGSRFSVDYGDGRVLWYTKSDLKDFDLAFAITTHKSQGAEYKTCIILCMDEHDRMLKRNLIYTAVSRAKNKVILIGTVSALEKSIRTEDASVRNSRLADIIVYLSQSPEKRTA